MIDDKKIEHVFNVYANGQNPQGATWLGQQEGNPWLINIVKGYKEIFGRFPTALEVQRVTPAFQAPGGSGVATIADLYYQEQNTPEKQAERKRAELDQKSPEQYGAVDQAYQSTLGRTATDEEKKHFGGLLASGDLDAYGLGQFLQQLPENITKQDQTFRQQLSGELQGQDQQYYQQSVMPAIQAQFASQGRSVDSSGYATALAQAAKSQSQDRERFLSNLSAQQYTGRQGAAREDYLTGLSRVYGAQDYRQNRNDLLGDRSQQRLYDIQDYNTQAQAYGDFLKKYGKRSSGQGIGALAGGVFGAGIGAYFGGPQGMGAGYQVGSGLGGGIGSQF